jgi:hypothetical protein
LGSSSKASKYHVAAVAPAGPATLAPPDENGPVPEDAAGPPGTATPPAQGSAGPPLDAGPAPGPNTGVPVETPPKRAHIRVIQDADGTWHVEVERDE